MVVPSPPVVTHYVTGPHAGAIPKICPAVSGRTCYRRRKWARTAVSIVAHSHPYVIGVDTHARNHAYAILAAATGELIDSARFPTTTAGMRRALSWARIGRRGPGCLVGYRGCRLLVCPLGRQRRSRWLSCGRGRTDERPGQPGCREVRSDRCASYRSRCARHWRSA